MEQALQAHQFVWGKTDQNGVSRRARGPAWNPLLAHVLDVAAVTGELWERHLAQNVTGRLADAFGRGDEATARKVVMFLAGLHDLGKTSCCFLRQFGTGRRDDPGLRRAREQWEREARAAGLPLPPALDGWPDAPHAHITAAHLPLLLGCPGCATDGGDDCHTGLHAVAALLGGHHGHIPDPDSIDRASAAADLAAWGPVWRAIIADTARMTGVDLDTLPDLIAPVRPSSLPMFAGLVILADWIGSDEHRFTYRKPRQGVEAWWRQSRAQARAAITALRLDRWAPKPAAWGELWPGTSPRPFQQATMNALPTDGPALVLIESDTGSGKTRLALWCAHQLAQSNGYQGLYMAMPTRAAANQIGKELRDFVAAAIGDQETANLSVVHGTAEGTDLVHDLLAAASPPAPDDLFAFVADTTCDARAVLSDWYLARVRGLVSAFGIGTVDQVVLGAQPSRHWMLRLLALAGKTVIIDEAHAYELFQQNLLCAALEWLADAGASVIVLSATLPASVRQALTAAWCTGHRTTPNDTGTTGPITITDRHGTITRTAPAEPPPALDTLIRFTADPGPAALAHRLLTEATDGGITAVIRNRVANAEDLHAEAVAQAPAHGWHEDEIVFLDGRLLPRDRLPVEDLLARLIGPHPEDRALPNPHRPGRLLVIATQVIEQSLDLDFDDMTTDLCPVDLVIQRRGRLHRHTPNHPNRPARTREPRLTLLWQPGPDGLPEVDPARNGDAFVYAPYTLAATWHTLTSREQDGRIDISTPRDSSTLIEAVYGAPEPQPGPIGGLLTRTHTAWLDALADENAEANARAFHPYTRRGRPTRTTALASGRHHGDGDDTTTGLKGIRALSRLGDPSINAIAVYRQAAGTHTYDPEGHHPADLTRRHHPAERRAQQRDHILNTLAIPAHWFHGRNAIPDPATWPPHTAMRHTHVAVYDPATGRCVSGPTGTTYNPTTGLGRT
ncbi:CRISPR-associated helicase Cas3' [Streptomyces sp. NPDC090085]|uniref:CRISPR-associated helicase Cas3' n=1 Tax=Streptomyces sp. NPDC090085 TaxID=3365943 RepID=UPI0038307F56